MTKRSLRTLISVAVVVVFGWAVVSTGMPAGVSAGCSLIRAQAQQNPCQAQEATLGAVQTLLATTSSDLEALRTRVASSGHGAGNSAEVATLSLPFYDDFSSNGAGWNLSNVEGVEARISAGEIFLATQPISSLREWVPGLAVDDFYVEATVRVIDRPDQIGFAVGNPANFHVIGLDFVSKLFVDESADGRTVGLIVLPIPDKLWPTGEFLIGLEAKAGSYTFYLNGRALGTVRFHAQGNQIGLYANQYSGDEGLIAFNDLHVTSSKQ